MARNHDRSTTPPHKRRAPKGSTIARFPSGGHTAESYGNFVQLQEQLGVSDAETVRQALARAVAAGPLGVLAKAEGDEQFGTWHLLRCPAPHEPCMPECSAVRTALESLGLL